MVVCEFLDCKKKKLKYNIGRCNLCENDFCGKHRLPETHKCYNLEKERNKLIEQNRKELLDTKCTPLKIIKI